MEKLIEGLKSIIEDVENTNYMEGVETVEESICRINELEKRDENLVEELEILIEQLKEVK